MAIVKNNPFLEGLSGQIGKSFVLRNVGGRTILSSMPDTSKTPRTPKQVAQQEVFARAASYARSVKNDPMAKAVYQARLEGPFDSAYSRALKDAMRPPQVTKLDVKDFKGEKGDLLHICAEDDFMVITVSVQVFDAYGHLLEEGPALPRANGLNWEYEAQTNVKDLNGCKLVVTALDKAGNTGIREQVLIDEKGTASDKKAMMPRGLSPRSVQRNWRGTVQGPHLRFSSSPLPRPRQRFP